MSEWDLFGDNQKNANGIREIVGRSSSWIFTVHHRVILSLPISPIKLKNKNLKVLTMPVYGVDGRELCVSLLMSSFLFHHLLLNASYYLPLSRPPVIHSKFRDFQLFTDLIEAEKRPQLIISPYLDALKLGRITSFRSHSRTHQSKSFELE